MKKSVFFVELDNEVKRFMQKSNATHSDVLTESICELVSTVICNAFGGEQVYIPVNKKSTIHARICIEFSGNNHRELAKKYNYSARYVRQIIKNYQKQA